MHRVVRSLLTIAALMQADAASANCPKDLAAARAYLRGATPAKQGNAGTGEALAFYSDSRPMMGAGIMSIMYESGPFSTLLSFRIIGNPEDFASQWRSAYGRYPATQPNCSREGRVCFGWKIASPAKPKLGQLMGASLYKNIGVTNYSHFDCEYAERMATL